MREFFRSALGELRRHLGQYLLLFIGTNLVLQYLLVPLFNVTAGFILSTGQIPYISYNNFGQLLTHHPIALFVLLLLLLVVLLVVFFQFVFLILGVKLIHQGQVSVFLIFRESFKRLLLLKGRALPFFLIYFVLFVPFSLSALLYSTPLLSKIKIPEFILEYIGTKLWMLAIIGVFYILAFILSLRYLMILPLMTLKNDTIDQAFAHNTAYFKGRRLRQLWHFAARILSILILTMLPSQALYYLLYFLQLYLDAHVKFLALPVAIVSMTLISVLIYLLSAFSGTLFFYLLTYRVDLAPSSAIEKAAGKRKTHKYSMRLLKGLVGFGIVLALVLLVLTSFLYMKGALLQKPLTISHRGVDNGNGVQNTIPALIETSKEKPDYVEMDVMETRDKQFVVMHDANLKALTGRNVAPQDLTLEELSNLTVSEHGKSAPLATFDDYLATAVSLNQKLLIEIKTSPKDSSDMLDVFLKKYGQTILDKGERIHSLDYRVIRDLKLKDSKLYVSFILPFNLTFPATKANAYTMEETTLNSDFVTTANNKKQDVFAWTVDDSTTMDRMLFMGANGIITDQLKTLKEEISDYEINPNYADRLFLFFNIQPVLGGGGAN